MFLEMEPNKKGVIVFIGIILATILLPFIINWLILQPCKFQFVGNDVDWLSFWGSYIGAIISAGVAFVILAIQYRQSQNENRKNRKLQIDVIEYQQKRQWLNDLKIKCTQYFDGFDADSLELIVNSFYNEESEENIKKTLKALSDKKNNSSFSFGIMFPPPSFLDAEERKILSELNTYSTTYLIVLYDIIWLYDLCLRNKILGTQPEEDELHNNVCKFKWGVDSFAISLFGTVKPNLIETASPKAYYKRIAKSCLRKIDELENVQNKLAELIDYEERKINKIIQL